ncbi:Hypothetical predicted protein [Cloeon dipterum]|uniref:UBC core domain-containing protein n=1 Tax=Cloeon dipterum TaxID=197152 RepID=A0A8S1CMY6_9INSE|nr:Hypothetical predicted protein [Cloeon dipterum]
MMEKKARPGVFLHPVNDSLDEFQASITGVEGTPYESGVFKLEIKIPDNYPFGVPVVRFITPLYHPNVDLAGRICLKSLKIPPAGDWSPSIMLVDLVAEIRMLLKHANPNDSLMPDIAQEFMLNRAEFDKKAREMTEKHAVPRNEASVDAELDS